MLDNRAVRPIEVGVTLMYTIKENYEQFTFLPPLREGSRPFIDLLGGGSYYREGQVDVPALLEQFREESRVFAQRKLQYHLY
ncbi:hypothetical protein D3C85_1807010 [compost metagenome]